jgi:hypothetical protein
MCERPAGPDGLFVLAAVIALSPLASLAGSPSPARADDPYRAGVARITVQDGVSGVVGLGDAQMLPVPFEVLVAYPTDLAEAPFEAGPFTIHASLNAPIARRRRSRFCCSHTAMVVAEAPSMTAI